jgi:hypothetical protein
MINDFFTNGRYISVISTPRPYVGSSSDSGALRWDNNSQALQVWNGHSWVQINNRIVEVDLSNDTKQAIDWANQQRSKQEEYKKLAEENVSVQAALGHLAKAQEQLDIIVALAKTHGEQHA